MVLVGSLVCDCGFALNVGVMCQPAPLNFCWKTIILFDAFHLFLWVGVVLDCWLCYGWVWTLVHFIHDTNNFIPHV